MIFVCYDLLCFTKSQVSVDNVDSIGDHQVNIHSGGMHKLPIDKNGWIQRNIKWLKSKYSLHRILNEIYSYQVFWRLMRGQSPRQRKVLARVVMMQKVLSIHAAIHAQTWKRHIRMPAAASRLLYQNPSAPRLRGARFLAMRWSTRSVAICT